MNVFCYILNLILLEPPGLAHHPMEVELDVTLYKAILLPCPVVGHPTPTIIWFRQNSPINRKNITL